eukprot:TRINITY_DN67_c0_g1_i1.p1 TRINITY_DN67_c0_g1~~TRINITY_DN67_c0_g1_i1.p1  ORF type:complete len:252 (+),score=60.11 TRINITY_DN67_c0_g1_i1:51-806(+)
MRKACRVALVRNSRRVAKPSYRTSYNWGGVAPQVTYDSRSSYATMRRRGEGLPRSHAVESILEYIQKTDEVRPAADNNGMSMDDVVDKVGFNVTQEIDQTSHNPVYRLTKTVKSGTATVTIPAIQQGQDEDPEGDEDVAEDDTLNFIVKVDKSASGKGILEWSCTTSDNVIKVDQLLYRDQDSTGDKKDFWNDNISVDLEDEELADHFQKYMLELLDIDEIVLAKAVSTIVNNFEIERDYKFMDGAKKFLS